MLLNALQIVFLRYAATAVSGSPDNTSGCVSRPHSHYRRTLESRPEPTLKAADPKARAKRAALKALRRARRAAEDAKVTLSDWEGDFLGSVEGRVETYGRAFGDPEKGPPGASLSLLQSRKLKEIEAKVRGKRLPRSSFRRPDR
jgi:hypothetical protein